MEDPRVTPRGTAKRDLVDANIEIWERELPELDLETEGIIERIHHLERFVDRAVQETLEEFELSHGEWKVLANLRRAGPPYRGKPGTLAKRLALSSGAMTNRLDNMEARGLVRRLDELAEFRDSLFDPKPIEVQAPRIQADPALLQRLAAPGKVGRDTASAQAALMKARLDAEFALLADGLARQQRALDTALQDRLVSIRDYHAQKTALEQRELDAEIARRRQELVAQQVITANPRVSESERLRARAEVAKLEADLIVLNDRRADIERTLPLSHIVAVDPA